VLKTLGYSVSTVSVVLLAIPGWKAATEQPVLFVALIGGMAASIGGMFLRWLSFRREQAEKQRMKAASGAAAGVLDCPDSRGEEHALDSSIDRGSGAGRAGDRRRPGVAA
jgi:hypothetical protein